jgi:hypothetical protein
MKGKDFSLARFARARRDRRERNLFSEKYFVGVYSARSAAAARDTCFHFLFSAGS